MIDIIFAKFSNIFPSWITCLVIIPKADVYKTIIISLIACIVGYFSKILLDYMTHKFKKHVLKIDKKKKENES